MNLNELRGSLSNIQDLARQMTLAEGSIHSLTFLIRSFTEKIKTEFEYWLLDISTEILSLEEIGNKPSIAVKLAPKATPNRSTRTSPAVDAFYEFDFPCQ